MTTSTSAPSSSEEVSSEEELSEDSSSQEKSDRSENSSSLRQPKILTLPENFLTTCCLRLDGSSWFISAEMLIVLNYNEENLCLNLVPTSLCKLPLNQSISTLLSKKRGGKIPFLRGSGRLRYQVTRWHGADVHTSLMKGKNQGLLSQL
jgi:hypothetical protein